jgi:integrase
MTSSSYKDQFTYIKEEFTENEIKEIPNEIPYYQLFLNRYSESSKQHVRMILVDFALYSKKHFNKTLLDVDMGDVIHYFSEYIDKLPGRKNKFASKNVKRRKRIFLNTYYEKLKEYKKRIEKKQIENPIPPLELYDFSGKQVRYEDLEYEEDIITLSDITKVVNYLYYNVKNPQVYMATCLILYSGCRIREAMHLELEKIDLKERWFITQIKSKKREKRDGIYFFPEFFVAELERYIKLLKKTFRGYELKYLFQSTYDMDNRVEHIRSKLIQTYIQKAKDHHRLTSKIHPHAFRDYVNTRRFELGLRDSRFLKLLLNQTVGDVNFIYFKKYKKRIQLRDNFYDKYNPFLTSLEPAYKLKKHYSDL